MNELIVKKIDFNGADLMAVQDPTTSKIHVGVSYICNGIGLTEKQKDRQVANIQEDIVLKAGGKKLPLKLEGQVRECLCIELDYLPLWLAKISITPQMQMEQPDVAKNLVEYQLKAKDVLAKEFLPKQSLDVTNLSPELQISYQLLTALSKTQEEVKELKQNAVEVQQTLSAIKDTFLHHDEDWRKYILSLISGIVEKSVSKDYSKAWNYTYNMLDERAGCDLSARLRNHIERLRAAGATKTTIKNARKLDMIEADPKLKEIYTVILKELAIGYTLHRGDIPEAN